MAKLLSAEELIDVRIFVTLAPLQKMEDANQEASFNAVAQLQGNQQDPSVPMRMCSSAEMLTAQDVLSFEMLKISNKTQAETEMEPEVTNLAHQTTPTPHNTPLGVTPCISPVRELDAIALSHQMSQCSDMEIVGVPAAEIEAEQKLPQDNRDISYTEMLLGSACLFQMMLKH
jgi:hypothetical protein